MPHLDGQIHLPVALRDAAHLTFRAWDSVLRDIRRLFGPLLSDEQMDALTGLAYIYIWFARQTVAVGVAADHASHIKHLWDELTELMTTAAAMGDYLDTPGEDLLINVEQWGRARIPVSYLKCFISPAVSDFMCTGRVSECAGE